MKELKVPGEPWYYSEMDEAAAMYPIRDSNNLIVVWGVTCEHTERVIQSVNGCAGIPRPHYVRDLVDAAKDVREAYLMGDLALPTAIVHLMDALVECGFSWKAP